MKILTSDQMRNVDRRATERFGIPSLLLMENAAIAVVDAIFEHFPTCERASIFCGPGSNGGDGFAVARHLENRGVVPAVFVCGDRKKYSGDAATNLAICERLALPIYDITTADSLDAALVHASDADVIVDAVFGTGLNRAPEDLFAELIRSINELALPIVAVDVPSGANASSIEPFDPCVQAAVTVTFAAPKMCHVFEPAAVLCGEVVVADISIPDAAIGDENVMLALTTPGDVRPLIAPRLANTHKGTYGHVGIVAGSPGRTGAAVMCARGAIRTGAGLVTVAIDREAAPLVNAGSIESMTVPIEMKWWLPETTKFLKGKEAMLVGPGLRDDEESYTLVRDLVAAIEQPLVIDASGLNAFAGRAKDINPKRRARVITPHPGEMRRLLGREATDRIAIAREAARITQSVVVLKGFQTLIADPEGHVNVNPTGNPGMATGGVGDVLGGMIAAFLARGVDPFDAACAAVYIHGFAGDLLKEEIGDTGLAAMDLAEKIPIAIQKLR
ncbi:MAG TPA: NAD(P)H-hydrate dehydratase [Thermoanaerobaculia bacterium]|nr:NAD(P)H-hydrate dehydratase [Thermoanaerobaculia bacterium]